MDERQIIWEYEVVGLEPEDDENMKLIKEYLKTSELLQIQSTIVMEWRYMIKMEDI